MKQTRNRKSSFICVVLWLGMFGIFFSPTGCAMLKASDIPRLDESYPLTCTIQKPALEVWLEVLKEVVDEIKRTQVQPIHVNVNDENLYIISWAHPVPYWEKCDAFEKMPEAATALTVVRLTSAADGTRVFIRRTCYPKIDPKEDDKLWHSPSSGLYEKSFLEALHRRLGL